MKVTAPDKSGGGSTKTGLNQLGQCKLTSIDLYNPTRMSTPTHTNNLSLPTFHLSQHH